MRREGPDGVPFPPSACVFGDEIGERVGNVNGPGRLRFCERTATSRLGFGRRRPGQTTKAARG